LSVYVAPGESGEQMHALIRDLFPICRSITGDGFRQSLQRLAQVAPITLTEVSTGTAAFDWTVPKEWNIHDAWIKDASGRRVVDFQNSNLHVVSYSTPVHARMSLAELKPHLHSRPDQPDVIPYRTSYYSESWGFCLSHRALEALPDGDYEVFIDSSLSPGHLTYGECVLPGASTDEILISIHSCHPSLANDNLSGMAVGAYLARQLAERPLRHTFRILFIPGTIGKVARLRAGLVRRGLQHVAIEVDGGVEPENVRALAGAGMTIAVAGTSVFDPRAPDGRNVRALRAACGFHAST